MLWLSMTTILRAKVKEDWNNKTDSISGVKLLELKVNANLERAGITRTTIIWMTDFKLYIL